MADNKQKVACIDFDGTLCDIDYPRIGPIKPGAKEAMSEYYGDTPFIHACERPVFKAMAEWLNDNDIEYDEIDSGNRGKVSADIYVDDKGIRYNNNWDEVMAQIINLEDAK